MELVPSVAALPMFLVAAAIFILGAVVVARERADRVSLSLFLLTGTVALWLFSISLMTMVTQQPAAMFFARAAYLGVAMIPAAVLQFTLALVEETRRRRWMLVAAWSGSAAFAILFLFTDLLLAGTWHHAWGFYPRISAGIVPFLVFFAIVLGGSLMLLARGEAQSEQERQRRMAFHTALAVGYIGSIDFLPSFGLPIFPLGFAAIAGFIVLAVRAIIRFRLTDLSASFIAEQLLETMHGGVLVVDTHGRVRVVNQVVTELLGWPKEELVGADLRELLTVAVLPFTDSDSFCRRSMVRNRLGTWRCRDGSSIELSVSATVLHDRNGNAIGLLYAVADLSDRRRAERNEFGATHDLLTRLPNRTRFAYLFDEAKQRITGAGRVPAILFLDLDGFKAVNDRHGHAVGDTLLQLVAARLRNAIRGDDVLARHGGDEFAIFVNLAKADDAKIVGDKLLRVVSEPYAVGDDRVSVTASIGAAFYPADGMSVDALIAAADTAMYNAKRAGKARLHVHAREDKPVPPPFEIDARA